MSQVDRGRKKCLEGKKQKKNISINKLSKRGDLLEKIFKYREVLTIKGNQLLVFLKKIQLSRFCQENHDNRG